MPTPAAPSTPPGSSALRYFDTAPHYGLGLSERRLGAALASRPREDYVLSSKVGRMLEPVDIAGGLDDRGLRRAGHPPARWDFSRDGIRRSLEESLERLGLDRLDIVYLHDPDEHWTRCSPRATRRSRSCAPDGVVGAIGAGMNQSAMLADLVRETDLDVRHARRSLHAARAGQRSTTCFPSAASAASESSRRVSSTAACSPGVPRPTTQVRLRRSPAGLVERARGRSPRICERHGTTLPAAALAFPLAHPAVVSVCIGARSAEQVARNEALYREPIASGLWSELKARGLLRSDAPVPD